MTTAARHWREYACEAACLGLFMTSAATLATLLRHPASPLAPGGETALARLPMGLAMGLTAIALIYSAWGRRSGAHMNPVITLTYLRLRKIAPGDAAWYVLSQVVGGIGGIVLATFALGNLPADPSVNYVATLPGTNGPGAALAAEAAISFAMMFVVLTVSNHARFSRFTGACAGALVCAFIVFESPLSGMSMNPARSLGSALLAGSLDSMWIYLAGPLAGMLLAAEAYVRLRGTARVFCAKLHHPAGVPCIFRCRFGELLGTRAVPHEGHEAHEGHEGRKGHAGHATNGFDAARRTEASS